MTAIRCAEIIPLRALHPLLAVGVDAPAGGGQVAQDSGGWWAVLRRLDGWTAVPADSLDHAEQIISGWHAAMVSA